MSDERPPTALIRTVGSAVGEDVDGVPLYDLRGLHCPLPVLKTDRRMRAMQSGERLWIETTDPLAVIDMPAFAREKGHELAATVPVDGGHRFLLVVGRPQQAGHSTKPSD